MADPRGTANPFRSNHVAGPYFVGREPEVAAFRAALDALATGESVHLFIAGVNGRGKSSCLARIEELAAERNILPVKVTLDRRPSGFDQMSSLTETLITAADERLEREGAARLLRQWDDAANSPFRQPRQELLRADALRHDLALVAKALDGHVAGVLLSVDLGERITPDALSALTSALEPLRSYLVALTVRLREDGGDPAAAGRLRLDELAREADRNLGASRAFGTAIGLGPFTPEQARDCVRTRLRDRAVGFDEQVIGSVVRVSERLPHRIIEYASGVYERAARNGTDVATMAEFREFFADRHRAELLETRALRDRSNPTEQRALRELARHDTPLTPLELARSLYPGQPDQLLTDLAVGLRALLDRTAETSRYCRRVGDGFEVPGMVRRHALELGMEPE